MLLIFDANALLHRLYHALPLLKDQKQRTVNALYGLCNILLKVLKEFKPEYGISCYDRPEPTFRHKILKEYKAQRPKTPDDLVFQIQNSKSIFEAFGFRTFEIPGYEADDLIGSLVEKFKKDTEIIIVTGDLDTLQLVEDERITVFTMKKGISETIAYNQKLVKEKYGIEPYQIPDYKALVGDPSDNIEGIKGIGPKSAQKILQKYKTIENLIEEAKKGNVEKDLREKILENETRLLLFKNLTSIKRDIKIEFSLEDLKVNELDKENLKEVLNEYNFVSIIKRISNQTSETKTIQPEIIEAKLKDLFESDSLFLFQKEKEIFFTTETNQENEIFKINLNEIPLIPFKKINLTAFEAKFIFKTNLKNFVKDYFDLKVGLWLTNPDIKKITPEKLCQITVNKHFNQDEFNVLFFKEAEKRIKEKIKNLELQTVWEEIEKKVIPIIARIENWGIKINQEKLKRNLLYYQTQKEILEKKIESISGVKINLNSWKEVNWLLFEKLKIKVPFKIKTKSGAYSTKKEVLEKLKDISPVKEIIEWRQTQKIINTYLENWLGREKIKTNLDQTLSATGRIISSNPNFQNLPKSFKKVLEVIEPEEGFTFVSFDYKQIEIFLAAWLAGEEKIVEFIQNDGDFHLLIAQEIFKDKEKRDLAKSLNFGILYGMGINSFSKITGLGKEEAEKYLENYFLKFPKLYKFLNELKEKARVYGWAENIFGRKRFLPGIFSESFREKKESERIAINMPIQSLAADILKIAMINLEPVLNENLRVILPIHDELIFEIKKDKNLQKSIEDIKNIMENLKNKNLNFELKLKVKVKEGENLAEIK